MKIEQIKYLLEQELGTTLNRKSRKRPYVYQRALYFKLCKDYTNLNLAAIGKSLNKHHATVIHGVKVFNNFDTWQETKYLHTYKKIRGVIDKKNNNNWLSKDSLIERLINDKINLKQENQQLTNKLKNNY